MALQLLEQAALGEASPIRPWLEALPQHVPLPWLYYNEEELAAIQDEDAMLECRQLRGIFSAACEVRGCSFCHTIRVWGPRSWGSKWSLRLITRSHPSCLQSQTLGVAPGREQTCPARCAARPLQEAGGAHSPERVAWALSVVHSRSFISGGYHVFVPGIDFCNHSPQPTAGVRCVHPLSQGAAAAEEVCPPSAPEPSRFELVAGEDGIRCVMNKGVV